MARSSVVATLILLFLAYLIGTTTPTPDEGSWDPSGSDPAIEQEASSQTEGEIERDRQTGAEPVRPARIPLAGKVVVVDPGHGGADPGAVGVSGRTRESYNTLFVAQDLKNLLERAGARVIMTRTTDVYVSLDARVAMANRSGADIFVSVHNDSNPNPSIRGVTTYFYTPQSRRLAEVMQASLATGLGARSVGVIQRPFVVVRGAWMPAVLVELGFVTNWTDEQLLADPAYRYRAAEAIYSGVLRYFEGT